MGFREALDQGFGKATGVAPRQCCYGSEGLLQAARLTDFLVHARCKRL
jgi:hypothetical protein